jgi:hypothetical protein
MGKPVCADWFGDYRSLCFCAAASVAALFILYKGGCDAVKTKRGMVLLLFMGMLLLLMSGCGAKYENPADLPFGSDGWQMQTAGEAIEALSAAGFTNIQENIKETSSADDAGKITKITVNGENLFRKGDRHEGTDVVEITYYSLKRYEAEMEIEVSEDAGLPVFTVNTNLPNGTRLELTLSNEESYSEQQTVKVKDGQAVSDIFWDNGHYLLGEYTLSVVMKPEDQNASVQYEIGKNGEAMTGPLVHMDENDAGKYLLLEDGYTSNYTEPEKISEDELRERFAQALSGFGNDYEIDLEGYVYTVSVWQDGLAACAMLAEQGVPTAVEQWGEIVDTTAEASNSLQELLSISGYGDYMVQIEVLNDQNHENTLLTVLLGMVSYNCVS